MRVPPGVTWPDTPPWRFKLGGAWCCPLEAESVSDLGGGRWVHTFQAGTQQVRVETRLIREEAGWRGHLQLSGDLDRIAELRFPELRVAEIERHDHLLVGHNCGDDLANPCMAIERFCRLQRRPPPKGLTFVASDPERMEVAYRYPAFMSQQLMLLHNEAASLAVFCFGKDGASRDFCAAREADSLRLGVRHWPHGRQWSSPEVAVSHDTVAWHAAARRYRKEMNGVVRASPAPEWMRESFHGWLQVMLCREGEAPRHRFSDLPALMRQALDHGLNVLHIAGWSGKGFDTLYPDYHPNPALGTVEELREAMDAIRVMGGHAVLYTNGRLVDPDSEWYKNGGRDWICLDPEGQPYCENWNTSVDFFAACPSSESWREQMAGSIERMVRDYGCHAVQIDQCASMPAVNCHNPAHGHAPAENFLNGLEAMLKEAQKRAKAVDPDFFIWCEGQHDRLGGFYDVGQAGGTGPGGWSTHVGRPFPELMRATFPDRIVVGETDTLHRLLHTFAQGKAFDVFPATLADPVLSDWVKRLIEVRQNLGEYLMRGNFHADEGLKVVGGWVARHRSNLNPDQELLILRRDLPAEASEPLWIKGLVPGTAFHPLPDGDLRLESHGPWTACHFQGPLALLRLERGT
ncbi:MAG: hypothetical protein JJU29_09240 [Verrucomicrobia bacterium]|nr:hypothetical protein [Verrucomicrobiota bacterium]MCH8513145.1 DUF6259 domain-containing protein [Kiritimatiellia bacterium]